MRPIIIQCTEEKAAAASWLDVGVSALTFTWIYSSSLKDRYEYLGRLFNTGVKHPRIYHRFICAALQ